MARGEVARNPPAGGDGGERLQDEAAPAELRMRDCQSGRAPFAAAPQNEVKVEHPRSPALAAAPAELALDGLEAPQHRDRRLAAFDQRDGIGEIAAGAAVGRVE